LGSRPGPDGRSAWQGAKIIRGLAQKDSRVGNGMQKRGCRQKLETTTLQTYSLNEVVRVRVCRENTGDGAGLVWSDGSTMLRPCLEQGLLFVLPGDR
jgi:hypothetical protein